MVDWIRIEADFLVPPPLDWDGCWSTCPAGLVPLLRIRRAIWDADVILAGRATSRVGVRCPDCGQHVPTIDAVRDTARRLRGARINVASIAALLEEAADLGYDARGVLRHRRPGAYLTWCPDRDERRGPRAG